MGHVFEDAHEEAAVRALERDGHDALALVELLAVAAQAVVLYQLPEAGRLVLVFGLCGVALERRSA